MTSGGHAIAGLPKCGHSAELTSLPSVVAIVLQKWRYNRFQCKKKDTYDYLITKCDNAVSQAFLIYLVLQSAAK